MSVAFDRALEAARDHWDPEDRIASIKRAVIGEVRSADPAVEISATDYFNHAFAPDLVLRWPREGIERLLYLRPQFSSDWLLQDLQTTAATSMVFALADIESYSETPEAEQEDRRRLHDAATRADTWITDPSGFAAVSARRTEDPVLGLLSQAMVRGGRGLTDQRSVQTLTRSTAEGFEAASNLETLATRQALDGFMSNLNHVQAGRLARVLRAVWEGHGGSASAFPGAADLGELTDDDLTYLLTTMVYASHDFWRRIGRTVTTEQVGRLLVDDPSTSLQNLVSANFDRLQAKAVRVLERPHQLAESEEVPRWMVDRGCLTLRGLNWAAYFAGRKLDELPTAEDAAPPSIDALRSRVGKRRIPMTRLEFGRGDRAVTYESREGLDVLEDPELAKLLENLRGSTVDGATAVLPGGGHLSIDFSQRSATGYTSAIFQLSALARTALPLLHDLAAEEAVALNHLAALLASEDQLFPEPLS